MKKKSRLASIIPGKTLEIFVWAFLSIFKQFLTYRLLETGIQFSFLFLLAPWSLEKLHSEIHYGFRLTVQKREGGSGGWKSKRHKSILVNKSYLDLVETTSTSGGPEILICSWLFYVWLFWAVFVTKVSLFISNLHWITSLSKLSWKIENDVLDILKVFEILLDIVEIKVIFIPAVILDKSWIWYCLKKSV